MIKSIAEATFGGRVSSVKELGYAREQAYLQFGIAVDRSKKNPDGTYAELSPYYYDLVAFGSMAERINKQIAAYKEAYGGIGMEICCRAQITTDVVEKDGQRTKRTSFKVYELISTNAPKKTQQNSGSASSQVAPPPASEDKPMELSEDDENLPFD